MILSIDKVVANTNESLTLKLDALSLPYEPGVLSVTLETNDFKSNEFPLFVYKPIEIKAFPSTILALEGGSILLRLGDLNLY